MRSVNLPKHHERQRFYGAKSPRAAAQIVRKPWKYLKSGVF
jgi:hypothetical protein